MTKTLAALALSTLGFLVFTSGCAPADESGAGLSEDLLTGDDSSNSAASGSGSTAEASVGTSTAEVTSCPCDNCVYYARCRQPKLPYGLTTWQDKLNRINSQRPRSGCVAMIYTGSYYGHVAYVRSVDSGTIYIAEGNWPTGQCGRRSGSESRLNIRGYWCP